jgi:hypothetical protein
MSFEDGPKQKRRGRLAMAAPLAKSRELVGFVMSRERIPTSLIAINEAVSIFAIYQHKRSLKRRIELCITETGLDGTIRLYCDLDGRL